MQRHSIKAILKTDKVNKKGHHPIYIRIAINKFPSFISTGYFVPETLWDAKAECVRLSHPLNKEINTTIASRKKELLNTLVNGSVQGKAYSSKALKQEVTAKPLRTDFFSFADQYMKEIGHKREELTLKNWQKHLRKLETFNGSRKLAFEDITLEYLTAFENHLRKGGIKQIRGDGNNYINAIMRTIRGFFNAARRKEYINIYPFRQYEFPERTPGNKEHLTVAELDQLEMHYHQIHNKKHRQAIAYFLFGCYTGLRVSDWYRFDRKEHIKGSYIRLRVKKNGEWVTLPIYPRLQRVLCLIKLYTLRVTQENLSTLLGRLAKQAGINKHISSHCARKTFAVTMCLERGITSETASDLMGITLQVFIKNYSKITPAKIEEETKQAWNNL